MESGGYDRGGVGDEPYYVLLHSILDNKYTNNKIISLFNK